ncbi:MAG: hypothetical protein JO036_10920 [Candidatus Eremiobacteraeota bacterium]|nr:hypothetical protein [Candidatus Eremiobacteraeota bacterium]
MAAFGRSAHRGISFCAAVVLQVMLAAQTANAVIIIDSQGNANFRGQVEACFERFKAAGGETKAILDQLQQPTPSSHRHTITISGDGNGERATNPVQGNAQANGTPNSGSDTSVDWNPSNVNPYSDGTQRDPCASLLHELKHAYDDDKGQSNPGEDDSTGIAVDEVRAATEENRYRKNANPQLPQRKKYGQHDLPKGAIF